MPWPLTARPTGNQQSQPLFVWYRRTVHQYLKYKRSCLELSEFVYRLMAETCGKNRRLLGGTGTQLFDWYTWLLRQTDDDAGIHTQVYTRHWALTFHHVFSHYIWLFNSSNIPTACALVHQFLSRGTCLFFLFFFFEPLAVQWYFKSTFHFFTLVRELYIEMYIPTYSSPYGSWYPTREWNVD